MEIMRGNDLPEWVIYPPEYLRLIDYGLVKFAPWYLLDRRLAGLRYDGLKRRYPDKKLFPFAARLDCDDIACWEQGSMSHVIVMHDFTSEGYENRRASCLFWDWFRSAIEDMINHESQ
jgi:hypothetical protein